MSEKHIVSVRTIAEYACAHGSLKAGAFLRSRLKEGTEGHRRIQDARPDGWQAELALSCECAVENIAMTVRGRADLALVEGERICVSEIKTTRVDPNDILKDDYPEHWAQAEMYAYMLCKRENANEARTELIYTNATGREHRFFRNFTYRELKERFFSYIRPYAEYLQCGDLWAETVAPTLSTLKFPFDSYREGQTDMSDAVYEAMDGSSVIIEAPTGIGKTAAALYGALRALGDGKITRIFYLTARTTGRRAAENALELMRGTGLKLRSVTITAKEKVCFLQKPDCGSCRYAMGYYDRCREAIREGMSVERLTGETIAEMARAHELCPFELSLDLTMIADAVICDYNYVFDPRIRLKRHFEKRSHAGILVDEAHNLIDRSREMYSAELSCARVTLIRAKSREVFSNGGPADQALTSLISALTIEEPEFDARREVPLEVLEAAKNVYETFEHLRPTDEEEYDLMMDCAFFTRIARMFDENSYRTMIKPEGKGNGIAVKLWCFAPEKKLRQLYEHVGGVALFSATLSPLAYYARSLGVDDTTHQLQLDSPFPRENLLTLRLPISVRFKDRSDTMEKVARVIRCMSEAHTGNYLVCFPSHAYLNQAYKYYRLRFPDDNIMAQKPSMSDRERIAFVDAFAPSPRKSMIAFIVLGGVFSEGVDLPGDLLSGTCVVSTGIPLPNPESELMMTLNADDGEEGTDAAYTYPGFRKVLQAAGRVIRTETDRGVVLLLDDRYCSPKYDELFPQYWHVTTVTGMRRLREQLENFWAK